MPAEISTALHSSSRLGLMKDRPRVCHLNKEVGMWQWNPWTASWVFVPYYGPTAVYTPWWTPAAYWWP